MYENRNKCAITKATKYRTYHNPANAASATPESCLYASFGEQKGSIPCYCPVCTCRRSVRMFPFVRYSRESSNNVMLPIVRRRASSSAPRSASASAASKPASAPASTPISSGGLPPLVLLHPPDESFRDPHDVILMHDRLVVLFVAAGRRLKLVPVLRNAEVHLRWRGGRGIVRLFGPLFRQKIAVVS